MNILFNYDLKAPEEMASQDYALATKCPCRVNGRHIREGRPCNRLHFPVLQHFAKFWEEAGPRLLSVLRKPAGAAGERPAPEAPPRQLSLGGRPGSKKEKEAARQRKRRPPEEATSRQALQTGGSRKRPRTQ